MVRKQLRPSQFVTTYGTGSLIALPSGYVVIPTLTRIINDLKKLESFNKVNDDGLGGLDKFEIDDKNMIRIIRSRFPNDDATLKIFRLPSNADLQQAEITSMFRADPFPRWSVCYSHSDVPILAKLQQERNSPIMTCPFCEREGKDPGRGTSVRFIQACQRGHMDDINWFEAVHGSTKCRGTVFLWQDSSSNFSISCYGYYDGNEFRRTTCGLSTNYFNLKRKSDSLQLSCSGIFQESGTTLPTSCDKNPKIVLKNSSNLRVPEIISSVYIPRYPGQLYRSLSRFAQLLDQFHKKDFTKEEFVKFLHEKKERWKIPLDTIRDVEEATLEDIKEVIYNIIHEVEDDEDGNGINYEEAIAREFESLLNASIDGYPPQKKGKSTSLHIEPTDKFIFFSDELGIKFRITPIRHLFVTRVQIGYSREVTPREDADELQILINKTGSLVKTYHDDGDIGSITRWFLGNQLVGEGLFIQACELDDDAKNRDPLESVNSASVKSWEDLFNAQDENNLEARRKTNPRFVWWHSLSHKIINQLAIDSGFASNSIGERIYCKWNGSKKRFESGILLYTALSGGDGTLGGLTSMSKQFDEIMKNATREMRICSNDPVCEERRRTAMRLNGAACHACMFISETSCELQNKFLDRNMIVEMMKSDK